MQTLWSHLAKTVCRVPTGAIVMTVSTTLLFCAFYSNSLMVVSDRWFDWHQKDMESFILGRIVKSRRDGMLSEAGLTGYCIPKAASSEFGTEALLFQYRAYLHDQEFGTYSRYLSQVGGQGMLFSLLDALAPFSAENKLGCFYGLTALLSSLTLAALVLWFHCEFGLSVALAVLASTVCSEWLTVFGRNLWWSLWAFYLPILAVMLLIRRSGGLAQTSNITLALSACISVFLKCLFNGYEYMTTVLIMMVVPLVYYGVADGMRLRTLIARTSIAVLASCVAILVSLAILSVQIAHVTGSAANATDHIVHSLRKRTHADPKDFPQELVASLESDPTAVIAEYLEGTYFNIRNGQPAADTPSSYISRLTFKIRYGVLVLVFLGTSAVAYLFYRRESPGRRRNANALLVATWFSVLAPLSWFVVFKAHSFIHTHMNYVVWQMPFTLFGFALCGLTLRRAMRRLVGCTRGGI